MNYEVSFEIDGNKYSQSMIEAFEFERNKHVLHEMIHLGVDVLDDGQPVSYLDVDFMSKKDAARVSLETRMRLGTDKLLDLYQDEIARTDRMWKDIVANYDSNAPTMPCITTMHVKGVTMDDLGEGLMAAMAGDSSSLAANPEHYGHVMANDVPTGFEGMGMFGGPNLMQIVFAPETKLPIKIDADYMPFTIGYSQLGDGTDMHTLAGHFIREVDGGLDMLLTVFFPQGTPQELVDGHKIHLASEFLGLVKAAAGAL
ncbi:hypothetical protein [Lacticaseibacillus daqingensis]|uniref:hypothetical protein n=1 Tax=Lacticaseibacillus daqingensis TaxID=2486014 RepID=UPI000F78189A|nr:hypothetical protein [Lacticaseibacillus daqingensis]